MKIVEAYGNIWAQLGNKLIPNQGGLPIGERWTEEQVKENYQIWLRRQANGMLSRAGLSYKK